MNETDKNGEAPHAPAFAGAFAGQAVVSFESRRAPEMASLVTRHGGVPITAPALREVPLTENAAALDFARALVADGFDAVILMTGVGTRALVAEVAPLLDPPGFAAALGRVPLLVVRGPKPAAALRELGLRDFVTVPEPNTWREVVDAVARRGSPAGLRVAVQEHGAPSVELYQALRDGGAVVTPIPVYKWALPEDTTRLRGALHAIASGRARIALFTSRAQIEHAFAIAAEEGIAEAVRGALQRGMVASIGPVCTEALRAEGLEPDLVPEHPKMGHLVKEAAERAGAILAAKGAA
jgi:uroporphyrinogen-III synthase